MDDKQRPTPAWIEAVRARFPTERTIDEALTRKLQRRAGGPYRPKSLAEIRGQLTAFAESAAPGFTVGNLAALGGGASKEQYTFDLVDKAGAASAYVLRCEPPESVVETHRLREYQMMRALGAAVPVPEVPWVDAEGLWFDRPALISRFVKGVTKPPGAGSNVTGLRAEYDPELRRELGAQFVDLLARIHGFDWRNAELDAFDAPAEGNTAGVHSVINWWDRVWEEDSAEAMPIIRLTAQWLRANAPKIDKVTVIHHDYRAGNFLFDPDSRKITAVLDWELSHLGDYHEDLAWTLQEGYGSRDEQGRFFVCGLVERAEFLSLYSEKTGFKIDPAKLAYYSIMNCWKSAIIVLATGIRCAMGGKSHQDILLTWLAGFGHVCIDSIIKPLKEAVYGS